MDSATTTITPPEPQGGPPQTPQAPWRCRYDHCFWSHSEASGSGTKFASQRNVYETLGKPLLTKAFEGYNTSLFAYGQTGSGKTYSMMGVPEDPGIIPRFAEDLFKRIENFSRQNTPSLHHQFDIKVSCYEIYNEKIYDLLRPNIPGERAPALRVREHASTGPYVENLTVRDVASQEDVKVYIDIANKNRATAATAMNDRSSRSHAVFNIILHQTRTENLDDLGEAISEKTSNVTLIDLAGSERADSAETTGERLKEGASINKSLSTLGHVISALSKRESFIPYRNSVLTWLLKESLGGNAQTAMLFTVSPSAAHLETTMSTLRYASTTRNVINVATVNEDPKGRIIGELRDEVRHLRDAVHILRDRLARAGLPYDDVCATPPLPAQRDKQVSLQRSNSRTILKRQLSETECQNMIRINQEVEAGASTPKVCVSVSVGDSFSHLPGISPSNVESTPPTKLTSTISRRNLADVEVNTSLCFTPPHAIAKTDDHEQIEKLRDEMRHQDNIIDDLRSKMAAMSEEFKMEKEAKDLNRRQLLYAAEEAEKEKANLRRKLMLAEAIIEKKTTPGRQQPGAILGSPATLQVHDKKQEPFRDLINVIRRHTVALKQATENKAPPPQLAFDLDKENNFSRMLTGCPVKTITEPPPHLREDINLARNIIKANTLSLRHQLKETYSVSHMGSSTGGFCKVVKVVTSTSAAASPPTPNKPLKAIHSPATTTRLMSIPEFEGKLEKLKGMESPRDPEGTPKKLQPSAEAALRTTLFAASLERLETPSSDQYETADQLSERSSSVLSRFSDSTAITANSDLTEGETFDVTSCDITCVSSIAS